MPSSRLAWSSRLQGAEGGAHRGLLLVAEDRKRDLGSRLVPRDHASELGGVHHVLAVDCENDVARAKAGLVRGAILFDLGDERTLRFAEADGGGDLGRQRLEREPELAARHVTGGAKLRQHVLERVDGDGKADAATLGLDDGVDADDLAAQVEERAAAVAGVDRGVGLDEIVVRARADRRAPWR